MNETEQRQYDQMQRDLSLMARRLKEAEDKLATYDHPEGLGDFCEQIKEAEGLKLCAYMDGGGYLHIGHGTRIGPSIAGARMPSGQLVADLLKQEEGTWISPRAAETLMREDVQASLNRLRFDLGDAWWLEHGGTPRGDGALDAYYTMGSLSDFPSAKRALREGDWKRAALELLYVNPDAAIREPSDYFKQTKGRAQRVAHAIAENVWS